jgi:hypothetical protein
MWLITVGAGESCEIDLPDPLFSLPSAAPTGLLHKNNHPALDDLFVEAIETLGDCIR